MSPVHQDTITRCDIRKHEEDRLRRLVAASREKGTTVSEIDEVLQARFHPSHSYVLAFVTYIDDTRGVVWATYRGEVHIVPVSLSPVVHRALQLSPPKVTLRAEGDVAHITATDIYGQLLTHQWSMPEH